MTNIILRKQAKEQGLLYYFTGKACKHGHRSERQTSNGSCVECYQRRYDNNKEDLLEYKREYYQKNHAHLLANNCLNQQNRREHYNEYKREHYRKNRAIYIKRARDRAKKIKRATPIWTTDYDQQRIQELYILRDKLIEETGIPHEVDHIIPLRGENVCGLHCPENLQVITYDENRKKGNKFSG